MNRNPELIEKAQQAAQSALQDAQSHFLPQLGQTNRLVHEQRNLKIPSHNLNISLHYNDTTRTPDQMTFTVEEEPTIVSRRHVLSYRETTSEQGHKTTVIEVRRGRKIVFSQTHTPEEENTKGHLRLSDRMAIERMIPRIPQLTEQMVSAHRV